MTKHFKESEFRCKDECGLLVVKPLLLERLEQLRAAIGRPIPIVSGFRCCVHNTNVGGAGRSRHTVGEAADIPKALRVTVHQAKAAGFTGIGIDGDSQFVTHVDVRPQRFITTWVYK